MPVLEKPIPSKQNLHCPLHRPLIRKVVTIRFHSSSSALLRSWDTRQACRWKTSFGMDCTKLQRAKVLRHLHSSSGSTPSALFTIFHRPSGFLYWIISELALIRLHKFPPKPANAWWSRLTPLAGESCPVDLGLSSASCAERPDATSMDQTPWRRRSAFGDKADVAIAPRNVCL